MGREIRRVPSWWEHPRDERGEYIPLFDRSYYEAVRDYEYAVGLWQEGRHPAQSEWPEQTEGVSYDEWESGPPDLRFYRQESWTEDDASMFVLYETVSEGTPLSPKYESLSGLLQWMLRNGYSQDEIGEIRITGMLPTLRAYKPADHIG